MAGISIAYWLGFFAALCGTVAYLPYIRGMLWGTTRPQRSTWLIWSVLSALSFFSNLNIGATASLPYVALQAGMTSLIFGFSIFFGHGSLLSRWDAVILAFATMGIVLWTVTSNPLYALCTSVGISALAGAMTVHKAYVIPCSENKSCWIWSIVGAGCGILAVGSWLPFLLLYPAYLFTLYASILIAMALGERKGRMPEDQVQALPLLLTPRQRVGMAPVAATYAKAA